MNIFKFSSHTSLGPLSSSEVILACMVYFQLNTKLALIWTSVTPERCNLLYNLVDQVCVWQKLFLSIYFTIQFIFTTIYGSTAFFGTIYKSYYAILINFYLLPLFTVLSTKSFQFQQNKWIPNRSKCEKRYT